MSPKSKQPIRPAVVEAQIDDNLRKIFEEDVQEELSEHLKDLVARLGEAEADTPDDDADGTAETANEGSEEEASR
ncbi:NepR family anti-sigma factor [Roseisalinus antarcticus]|uniref:Anti-sigma factor NepR domain-containing protein n=1 Tax=Roseisalinus antarcticus TaxID=254357 RepID=A0A1Y5U485_9RHOB|nr:hypothetical protein [Roseisalinus antarcticus]SLN76884.1 hypothetical protein ROA7023_04264 [Roseisalinus antarcticus]